MRGSSLGLFAVGLAGIAEFMWGATHGHMWLFWAGLAQSLFCSTRLLVQGKFGEATNDRK